MPKLATLASPDIFAYPVMFAPVGVITNVVLPPAFATMLPFTTGTLTLELPLLIPEVPTVTQLKLPEPLVCKNCPELPPVIITLPFAPKLLVPETFNEPTFAKPVVLMLAPVISPVALINPLVVIFPPVTFPVADSKPPVNKLPPVILPVAVTKPPDPILPIFAFPETDTDVNVPTLVILGCDAIVTLPAYAAMLALSTVPTMLAACILNNALPLPAIKLAVTKLPKLALVATKLPVAASSVILPVVIPFLTTKFFVVILYP